MLETSSLSERSSLPKTLGFDFDLEWKDMALPTADMWFLDLAVCFFAVGRYFNPALE
jgi:hypothetical protein